MNVSYISTIGYLYLQLYILIKLYLTIVNNYYFLALLGYYFIIKIAFMSFLFTLVTLYNNICMQPIHICEEILTRLFFKRPSKIVLLTLAFRVPEVSNQGSQTPPKPPVFQPAFFLIQNLWLDCLTIDKTVNLT